MHHQRPQSQCVARCAAAGWSLLELLVMLLLLGVLLILGATAWTPVRQKYQLQAQAEDLLSTVVLAHSEALKRGVRVTACVSSDGLQCATSGDWTQGWILFEDADGNASRDAAEPLLSVHAALPEGVQGTGNGTMARYVSYGPNGRSLTVTGAYQFATITLCRTSTQVNSGWKLVINAVGKARLEAATLASCG